MRKVKRTYYLGENRYYSYPVGQVSFGRDIDGTIIYPKEIEFRRSLVFEMASKEKCLFYLAIFLN